MKKIFLQVLLFCLLSVTIIPLIAFADGNPTGGQPLVPCGNAGQATCTICDFFTMLLRIYNFIVWDIATPLAVIALIIGGILMMISAGNPNLMSKGKQIFWAAVIGLALVFCSWLIIDFVLHALGYTQNWSSLNLDCTASSGGFTPGGGSFGGNGGGGTW